MNEMWRCGRSVGRTIYAMAGARPSDRDVLIGVMDTPDLAAEVVAARNGVTPKPVGAVLSRDDVRELAYREIVKKAAENKAIRHGLDPLGAFTFFEVLDAITDAVVAAVRSGEVPSEIPS